MGTDTAFDAQKHHIVNPEGFPGGGGRTHRIRQEQFAFRNAWLVFTRIKNEIPFYWFFLVFLEKSFLERELININDFLKINIMIFMQSVF